MNLAGAFSESVQKNSEKTALFWSDLKFTYSELSSRSLFVAGILRSQFNIAPGARVALWLKNCPEFIPALFGILQTGAVVVPINNFLKPDEVAYILNDAGIDVIITDTELSANFEALKAQRASLQMLNIETALASFPIPPGGTRFDTELLRNPTRKEEDLAVLI